MHWLGRHRRFVVAAICALCAGVIIAVHFFPSFPFLSAVWRQEQNFEDFLQREGRKAATHPDMVFLGIDQTTLRPAVDVEYALMKDGKELGKQLEDWRGNSESGQRLTLSKLIDSRGLTPGDYNVEVRVRDHVSGQSLVQSAKFTILP